MIPNANWYQDDDLYMDRLEEEEVKKPPLMPLPDLTVKDVIDMESIQKMLGNDKYTITKRGTINMSGGGTMLQYNKFFTLLQELINNNGVHHTHDEEYLEVPMKALLNCKDGKVVFLFRDGLQMVFNKPMSDFNGWVTVNEYSKETGINKSNT